MTNPDDRDIEDMGSYKLDQYPQFDKKCLSCGWLFLTAHKSQSICELCRQKEFEKECTYV